MSKKVTLLTNLLSGNVYAINIITLLLLCIIWLEKFHLSIKKVVRNLRR